MRFTILADYRSTVIGVALTTIAVLPLLLVPAADPYQPVRALAVAVAAGALVVLAGFRGAGAFVRRATVLVAVLLVLFVVSALWNGASSAVFGVHGRFQGLVSGGAVVLAGVAGVIAGGGFMRRFTWALAAVGVVVALLMVAQWSSGSEPQAWTNSRVVAGGWLAVAGSVVAAAALTAGRRERVLCAAALMPMAFALGLSGSRGAWLGAAAGTMVLFAVQRRLDTRAAALAVAAAGLVIAGAVAGGADSAGKLDPRALGTGSASSRLLIWRDSVELVVAEPLLGVGPGRFLYEFPAVQSAEHAAAEAPDTRPDSAHSAPLHMAAETGIPAALIWFVLVGVCLRAGTVAATRRDGAAALALAGLAAYVGQSLFSVPAVEVDALGAFLAGVCLVRGDRAGSAAAGESARGDGAAGPKEAGSAPTAGSVRSATAAAIVIALAVCAAAGIYLPADQAYRASAEHFARGDLALAAREASKAVSGNPLVDVYRVAWADTVIYAGPGPARDRGARDMERVLGEGLRLEPRSYDLALAKARVMAAGGADDGSVAAAYLRAVTLYPLGIEVREAAADALRRAGRTVEAERMDEEVARLRSLRGGRT